MLGTEYIIKYLSDIKGATEGAKEVEKLNADIAKSIGEKYATATKIIGQDLQKISQQKITFRGQEATQTVQQLGTVVQMADGSFQNFTKTNTLINGILLKSSGSLKDVSNQFTKTSVETAKADKNFISVGENIKRLAERAVLTIPIWLLLRSAVMGTLNSITQGFKDLADESLVLQKVKNTFTGSLEDITANMEKLKKETQALALASGISHEKIIQVFQKFSAVGLDFASAMSATNAVVKLSVITQGEASLTADSLAHAISVLIDTNASAIEKQKQFNDIVSLTAELWKTNGFNIEEFTGALEKFSITAKSVNFTTGQTLALLATLSKSGLGSAGNLLRNSIGQLLVNLDKLAGNLGVKVNPALDDTFTILMKVLDQLDKLQKTKDLKGLESAKEALKDIFGGTRSAVPITALAALYDVLKKNIALTPDINNLNNSFQDTEKVLGNLVARFHVANAEIGKAFVTGVIGGEDFNASLATIVDTLVALISTAEKTGEILREVFSAGLLFSFFNEWDKGIQDNMQKISKFSDDVSNAMLGKLAKEQFDKVIAELEQRQHVIADRIREPGISQAELEKRVATATRLAKTIDVIKIVGPAAPKENLDQLKEETKLVDRQIISYKDAQAVAKSVLADSIARLREEGALTSQILIATDLRSKQLGIEEKSIDKLNRKLEIERAINDEKRLQGKLSSDTMKLFEITKTEGTDVARQIGDVLAGNLDFDTFVRIGGKALNVFKKQFSDLYSQQQALQFFKGERVAEMPELQGGTSIAIKEEALRKSLPQYDVNTAIARMRAERQFQRLESVTTTVPVTVNANIDISKLQEVKKQFIDEVSKQLPQAGTEVNDALVKALTGKQGYNV